MDNYDVQITTELGEVLVLNVFANSSAEAEMTAINMVETGQAGCLGTQAVDCFAL